MVIAIDFDGTIVDDAFPEIGEPKLFVFETLKQLIDKRHQLILWTTRTGNNLQKAKDFCKENGVEFYAINNSYPDEKLKDMESRKIICDLFISNKNFGGIAGWGEIWQEVQRAESGVNLSEINAIPEKGFKGILKKLFTRK